MRSSEHASMWLAGMCSDRLHELQGQDCAPCPLLAAAVVCAVACIGRCISLAVSTKARQGCFGRSLVGKETADARLNSRGEEPSVFSCPGLSRNSHKSRGLMHIDGNTRGLLEKS